VGGHAGAFLASGRDDQEARAPFEPDRGLSALGAGELEALKWEDIGTEKIWIRRSRQIDGTEKKPKNGRERQIAFVPPARVLDDLPHRPDPYVFHSPRGKPLDKGSLFYAWREVRATAGLRHIRWHDLRHFCATQLLELGLDHFAVSIQLGHTDGGALVMSRYGHPSEDGARDRLLGAFQFDPAETGSRAGSWQS
jgi:integrase